LLDGTVDEDAGLLHAGGAIASLLRACWLCAWDEIEPTRDRARKRRIGIVATLLAQYAGVHTRDYAAERPA
jgi:hypothetical protein